VAANDRIAWLLAAGSAAGLVLVGSGWLRHPAISLLSVAAAALVLALYAAVALRWASRLAPPGSLVARAAWWGGLAAGLIFCGEIILEYVLLPADNSRFGLVEFGTVWLTYLAVAAVIASSGRPLRACIAGAVLAAMISSVLWCVCLLATYQWFEGTARQASVLLAEGDFDDFRRSGMASFATFEMEDLFGATFFHLLLGPVIAAVLACGAWAGARAVRLIRR
jgi:hypothetical protein